MCWRLALLWFQLRLQLLKSLLVSFLIENIGTSGKLEVIYYFEAEVSSHDFGETGHFSPVSVPET